LAVLHSKRRAPIAHLIGGTELGNFRSNKKGKRLRYARRQITAGIAALVCSTSLVALSGSPASAKDGCDDVWYVTSSTTEGRLVWIPSSRSAGAFQWGGNQSLSTANGELNATTDGYANTLGGSGGVNYGIYKAEIKYDHQWNHSTTVTKSYTDTFTTNSGDVSRKLHWRWKLYQPGRMFVGKRVLHYHLMCAVAERWVKRRFIVPLDNQDYSFDIETYGTKGWLHDANGKPFRP